MGSHIRLVGAERTNAEILFLGPNPRETRVHRIVDTDEAREFRSAVLWISRQDTPHRFDSPDFDRRGAEREILADLWRGGLLAAYYWITHCPSSIDAYDAASLLILSSSVVAGHPYAGLSRFTVASKSPLTGGIGEARCEGPFALALKGSGVDAIVIGGVSLAPVFLVIEDGAVAFQDAASLWGWRVSEAVD